MTLDIEKTYNHVRSGGAGFYEQKRGLIAVWGKEAVQFLDGMITNDMKILEDGAQMLAAFPNAQGRLLAVVRVLRQGGRFLIETEEATREKLFQNLFRFTFAGDFFIEDLSGSYRYFEIQNPASETPVADGLILYKGHAGLGAFVAVDLVNDLRDKFVAGGAVEISGDLYEVLRIENGLPKYGVDMDETTIVPELGLDDMISYTKGCYVGQEIIARIHFRGHVAKQLAGLTLSEPPASAGGELVGAELKTVDGKNAGRITSVIFSLKLDKTIALAFVRYDYLAGGTELVVGSEVATVSKLPFVSSTSEEKVHAQK